MTSMNGHSPDDSPEIEQEPQGGFKRGRATPSIHDLAMMGLGAMGGSWNGARELITGSHEPEEYLPRGVYTRKDIARRKRIVARQNRISGYGSRLKDAIWVGDQMAIGLDGRGREDAIKVLTAQHQAAMEERRGFLERMNRPGNQGQNGS